MKVLLIHPVTPGRKQKAITERRKGLFPPKMREIKSCAYCKPADITCQISKECKRQRREKK